MKLVKVFTAILGASLLILGCQKGKAAPEASAQPTGEVSYPIDSAGVTLTWWEQLETNVSANYANLGDTPFGKALQEKTGIKINFQHPPASGVDEQFNLLVADILMSDSSRAGEFPDIISRNWFIGYTGGPEKALNDGAIIKLNDVIDKYAPNLKAYLAAHPDVDKMVKTDSGDYYCFPFIRGDPGLMVSRGLMIRKDWLDELGLQMPETIDEWHTALKAFKEKKNVPAPLTFEYTQNGVLDALGFALAYNAPRNFFVGDDGKVHYGPIESGRREYLRTMAQWYKEGLLDPDIATLQLQQVSAKMTSGASGASMGWAGSRMGVWINSARSTNPSYDLEPAPFPVVNKGDKPKMNSTELPYAANNSAAISSTCKNVELAARLLDYAYSPEGHMLYNFGVEGESYNMIDGYPTYSDWVFKNPNGWPLAQAIAAYARACYNGAFVQDIRYNEQYLTIQAQKDAIKIWTIPGSTKYVLPTITPTTEESREFAQIMNEVINYRDEMELKIILGTESLANWDNYTAAIKKMGIDRAIAIEEGALARFNAR